MLLHLFKRQTYSVLSRSLERSNVTRTCCRCKFFQVPSPEEEISWSRQYPDPIRTVTTFLEPITQVDPEHEFKVEISRSRYVKKDPRWKVKLKFTWPQCFTTSGVNTNQSRAMMGAFLGACHTLNNLGLLTSNGEEVPFVKHLILAKEKAATKLPCDLIHITSRCELLEEGSKMWHTEIRLHWPTNIVQQGVGNTPEDALRNAAVHVFVKLKVGKYLDRDNHVKEPSRIEIPKEQNESADLADYEVHVDSSPNAYGAYLYSNMDEGKDDMVPWITAAWPEGIKDQFMAAKSDSTMFELCGVLSAVYTWKKKFVGKHVVIYNDNTSVIDMINKGLTLRKRGGRPSIYTKTFAVLRDTCARYNIWLTAKHVNRHLNRPADHLSKLRVSDFKQMVPKAKLVSKKSKKLLFYMPLIEPDKS